MVGLWIERPSLAGSEHDYCSYCYAIVVVAEAGPLSLTEVGRIQSKNWVRVRRMEEGWQFRSCSILSQGLYHPRWAVSCRRCQEKHYPTWICCPYRRADRFLTSTSIRPCEVICATFVRMDDRDIVPHYRLRQLDESVRVHTHINWNLRSPWIEREG